MKTVADITESLVKESPYLEEALGLGVINLTALAKKFKPRIEQKSLKKTSIGAVAMALHRLAGKLKKQSLGKTVILMPKDLTLRSNITEYVFELSPTFGRLQQELISSLKIQKEVYITTAQGISEATIFISSQMADKVETMFKKEKLLFKMEKLSIIILRFSENTIRMPGVYYNILKALAWEGVPINEVISVGNELSLIFEFTEIEKAFGVIQQMIK